MERMLRVKSLPCHFSAWLFKPQKMTRWMARYLLYRTSELLAVMEKGGGVWSTRALVQRSSPGDLANGLDLEDHDQGHDLVGVNIKIP
jgi:hypothetical protein